MFGNKIFCAHCLEVISNDYEADRGKQETELYQHKCKGEKHDPDKQSVDRQENEVVLN